MHRRREFGLLLELQCVRQQQPEVLCGERSSDHSGLLCERVSGHVSALQIHSCGPKGQLAHLLRLLHIALRRRTRSRSAGQMHADVRRRQQMRRSADRRVHLHERLLLHLYVSVDDIKMLTHCHYPNTNVLCEATCTFTTIQAAPYNYVSAEGESS